MPGKFVVHADIVYIIHFINKVYSYIVSIYTIFYYRISLTTFTFFNFFTHYFYQLDHALVVHMHRILDDVE